MFTATLIKLSLHVEGEQESGGITIMLRVEENIWSLLESQMGAMMYN